MSLMHEVGLKRVIKYIVFGLWRMVFNCLPTPIVRKIWLQVGGSKIGRGTYIDKLDFINLDRTGLKGLHIGKECFLGRGVMLDLAGSIDIQSQATMAVRSMIITHVNVGFRNHPLHARYPSTVKSVNIHTGSFIGAGAIVLPGVTIGKQSCIAAGSVVRQSTPPFSLIAGVPAQVKK